MSNIDYFNPEWQIDELIEKNPMIWMVQINGLIVDIRDMSPEIQQQAFEMGIIPYIPEEKTESKKQEETINESNTNKKQREEIEDQLKLF